MPALMPRPGFPGEKCLKPTPGADAVMRTIQSGYVPVKIDRVHRADGREYVICTVIEASGAYPAGHEVWTSRDSLFRPQDIVLFPGNILYSILAGSAGRPVSEVFSAA